MGTLKDRLNDDLHSAMKSRDELTTSTLRMALTAVRNAETAGDAARVLSDDEVLAVLAKEAKKRREAATAFAGAGRGHSARRAREPYQRPASFSSRASADPQQPASRARGRNDEVF